MTRALVGCLVLTSLVVSGCGHRSAPTPKAKPTAAVQRSYPKWVPKDPSPEFLRAAKVLRPTSNEELAEFAKGDPTRAALITRASRTWAAAFAFFGTLSDEQMKRFVATKELRMPVKSLSARQRAAFDAWLEVWRKEMKGSGTAAEDFRVVLLKMRARDDLSNVDVGFTAGNTGHRAHMKFWVRQPDGSDGTIATDFANM